MSEQNIYVSSVHLITHEQTWNDLLKNKPVKTLQKELTYVDYQPTRLQFKVDSSIVIQNISIRIPYFNRITETQAKHSVICWWDSSNGQWRELETKRSSENQELSANSDRVGLFCVFVNQYWYTSFTQRLADEYPQWSNVQSNEKSTGQLFLNYFGIELETVKDYLEWIQGQKYIATADLKMYDWIQMYSLPEIDENTLIKVFKKNETLKFVEVPLLDKLQTFFYNDTNNGGIVDYRDNRFYTSFSFGQLRFDITSKIGTESYFIDPIPFHVWNSFDEFGLLLGVKRFHLEKNEAYKERILDVFRYPSGTHDIGLTNGIARELNLISRRDKNGKKLIWKDDTKTLILKNRDAKVIDLQSLKIDNTSLNEGDYTQNEVGDILIYPKNTRKEHEVSFIYGIEKFQLYERDNEKLYQMMFNEDGQSSWTMLRWVEYINTIAPVMWDRFNWDDGFWDTIDKSLTGLGYVPNIWDSDIENWKTYIIKR